MADSIHGHEVIRMIIDSDRSFTVETLESEIARAFGDDARFHTCSADDLTARELIAFLSKRGKFIAAPDDDGFRVNEDRVCKH